MRYKYMMMQSVWYYDTDDETMDTKMMNDDNNKYQINKYQTN